jgi:divalent metal cation (Fe/Co/Zn/Cd) transporter
VFAPSILSFLVLKGAWELISKSFRNLMDHELEPEKKEEIIELIKNHPDIIGFHDLKTRYAGNKAFVQFHVEIDRNFTLMKVHGIVEALEDKIISLLPGAEVIIHQDPYGVDEDIQYKD